MQFELMLVFLAIWLLSLWVGSVTLEATGLERHKARFQALSALTGTGFTTREAESVVNHHTRRSIVSWLMFIGNAGLILFIIALMLYLRATLTTTSLIQIGIILGVTIFALLFIWLGAMDRLSTRMVRWFNRKGYLTSDISTEILHQAGDYAIARIMAGDKAKLPHSTLKSSGFWGRGFTILAIEQGNTVMQLPDADVPVQPEDHLLCYGTLSAMNNLQK